jgi:UPF0288 family protein (methanogenesis marker protein 3)
VSGLNGENKPVAVQVNEKKVSLPYGSTIADALAAAGFTYKENTIIGIVAGREETRKEVATEFRVFTSKGEIKVELTGDAMKRAWLEGYNGFVGTKAR